MKVNFAGKPLDSNGYSDSILQDDLTCCFLCGRRDRKLDRHEPLSGAYRNKSKADGLWVMLCHEDCHLRGVHGDAQKARELRLLAQREAMSVYGWTIDEFRMRYGKSYLSSKPPATE